VNLDELRVYTVFEVAALLRVDHNTIRRRIRSGDIEAIDLGGGMYRIEEAALVDYLLRCKQAAKTA
jgi:excisionase family DNA binding protein